MKPIPYNFCPFCKSMFDHDQTFSDLMICSCSLGCDWNFEQRCIKNIKDVWELWTVYWELDDFVFEAGWSDDIPFTKITGLNGPAVQISQALLPPINIDSLSLDSLRQQLKIWLTFS